MSKTNPLLLLILSLGVFGIITTEMGIVGVLPQISQKFQITASEAGWLVSLICTDCSHQRPVPNLDCFPI